MRAGLLTVRMSLTPWPSRLSPWPCRYCYCSCCSHGMDGWQMATISVGLTWKADVHTDLHLRKQARKPTGVGGARRPPAPALAPAPQAAIGGTALPRGTSAPSAICGRADAPPAAAAAAAAGGSGSGSAGWLRRRGCPGAPARPGGGRRGGAVAVSAGRGLGCAGGAAE